MDVVSADSRPSYEELVGRYHTAAREHVFELQSVHPSFGFEVIIRDHECDFRLARDCFHPLFPSNQFVRFVQIIVAI